MLDLITKTSAIDSPEERRLLIAALSSPCPRARIVSWLNAHAYCMAQRDPALRDCLLRSSSLLLDGVAMAFLMKLARKPSGINMNGTDLIPEILRSFKGRNVMIFGTQEPYLSQAVAAIKAMGVNVVGQQDGFQPEESYVAAASKTKVDLILLGMGVPKQEKVSLRLAQSQGAPLVILNGGAILDFLAGRFPRAPRYLRRLRLEWLFRLFLEPQRLWRRYIGSLPELTHYALRVFTAARKKI